ncbi:hypothetical protein EGW08_005183 [Elysia chlorotica]|uniref:E3 ubiquitin-protein ligase E3D n=1 Tax=Elysia chlorotica TaxID=188477 RepID=A0A433TZQ1_ELYCH|nr:hypothetical protein EGW08_005183 [Elysia chlorotica]
MSADQSRSTRAGPSVKLRAEFKPLLSAVTLSFELSRRIISSSPRLEVTNHSIKLASEDWVVIFSICNLSLNPSSCRNLRWVGPQELQLTLVATWIPSVTEAGDGVSTLNATTNGVSKHFQPFKQDQIVAKIQKCHPHCYCIGCGAQILNPSCQFKRVLPLPSENWSDFADIWFCHNHQHSTGHGNKDCDNGSEPNNSPKIESGCGEGTIPEHLQHVRSKGLLPRPDDCLVSSLYMLVSARQVNPSAIACSTDRLVCKRCGNFLGFVKLGDVDSSEQTLNSYLDDPLNGVYKIYFHAVSFSEDGWDVGPRMLKVPNNPPIKDGLNSCEQSVEDFICGLLKDQSTAFTSFRFILHSSPCKGNNQSGLDILLWLLDQELYLYSSTSDLPTIKTGKIKASQPNGAVNPSSSSIPSQSSSKTTKNESKPVSFVKVQPSKHMKILYKADFCPPDGVREIPPPEVFMDWQKDNTVHGLSLPQPLCQQLLGLLVSSTAQLNPQQRLLNGFHIGYLKTS